MKIVINADYGGFALSKKVEKLCKKMGLDPYTAEARSDPRLVDMVEKLGAKANGYLADLKVVEIPDDVKFTVEMVDGLEWVAEKHRTWH